MRLSGLVLRNLHRHRRSFAFAVFGILLGVSSLVLFLALGQGLRQNVLERIFQVDQVEVVPRRYQVGALEMSGSLFSSGTGLDEFTLEDLRQVPGVAAVYPKMQLAFPSLAWGGEGLFGRNFSTEFMADGMPAELIEAELPELNDPLLAFRDWDLDLDEGGAPFTCDTPDAEGTGEVAGCPPGRRCNAGGACERVSCEPVDEVLVTSSRSTANRIVNWIRRHFERRRVGAETREIPREFLDEDERQYRVRVNRAFAEQVLEALPTHVAAMNLSSHIERAEYEAFQAASRAHANALREAGEEVPRRPVRRRPMIREARVVDPADFPCEAPTYCPEDTRTCEMPIPVAANPFLLELINTSVQNVLSGSDRSLPGLSPEALIGFTFDTRLGRGYLGTANQTAEVGTAQRRLRLVGWSPRAMRIGTTVPLSYVQRFNAIYKGEDSTGEYHAILVVAESNDALAGVVQQVENELDLAIGPEYQQAKRGSLMIILLTIGLLFISFLIFLLAALNITHTFFMVIAERRNELGLLRAVGARRANIRSLVLREAAVIGLIGAILGVGLARLGGVIADLFLDCRVPAAMERWCVPDFPFKPDSFFLFEPWIIATGFGTAVLFSIVGAYLPAWRASRMDPADALR